MSGIVRSGSSRRRPQRLLQAALLGALLALPAPPASAQAPAPAEAASDQNPTEPAQPDQPPDIRPMTADEQAQWEAWLAQVKTAADQRRFDDAIALLRRILALEEATFGRNHPEAAGTRSLLAEFTQAAEAATNPSSSATAEPDPPPHTRPMTADEGAQWEAWLAEVKTAADERRYDDAINLLERILPLEEATFGPSHPEVAGTLQALAVFLREMGRADEADARDRRAQAILEEASGSRDADPAAQPENVPGPAAAVAASGSTLPPDIREMTDEENREYLLGMMYAVSHHQNRNLSGVINNLESILRIEGETFGNGHPKFADTLMRLGRFTRENGQCDESASYYRRALAILEARLGVDHPDTAESRSGLDAADRCTMSRPDIRPMTPDERTQWEAWLAEVKTAADERRYDDAIALLERALAIVEATFGPHHPEVAETLQLLSRLARNAARPGQAEAHDRRALAIRLERLGPDHPDTLTSRHNLAFNIDSQGRHADAEPLWRQTLASRLGVLGPDHLDTLGNRNNLALNINDQGRHAEAEELHRQTLADALRVLGPDDPHTFTSRSNLASALTALGRYVEAESLYRQTLADRLRVLGPDHPDTLNSRHNLAANIAAQGRHAEAEPLHRQTLADMLRLQGPGHPQTLTSRSSLAGSIADQGRYAEAEPLFRQTFADQLRVLGPDHPDTLASLGNLASSIQAQGRHAEAEPLFRQTRADMLRVLGPGHPYSLTSRNNLAFNIYVQGRYAEAELLFRETLADRLRVLGAEHPDVAVSAENLAEVRLYGLGDALGALGPARQAYGLRRSLASRETARADAAGRARAAVTVGGAADLLVRAAYEVSRSGGGAAAADRPEALRTEAFAAAQEVRSSGAADALARAAARIAAGTAGLEADARSWDGLLERRAGIDLQVTASFDRPAADGEALRRYLAEQRAAVEAEIAAVEARLRSGSPAFFALVKPEPVPLARLQGSDGRPAVLGPDEVLVLLTQGSGSGADERPGFVFAVTREGMAWSELGLKPSQIRADMAELRALLDPSAAGAPPPSQAGTRAPQTAQGGGGLSGARRGFRRSTAQRLYQGLFGSPAVRDLVEGKGRWILAPQGDLLSLPFSVLVMKDAPGGPAMDADPGSLRATAWLGVERTVAVVPSVPSLATQRSHARAAGADGRVPLFSLADPAFEGAAGNLRSLGDGRALFRDASGFVPGIRGLPRLPGTRSEALAVAEKLGAGPEAVLLGAQANETRLLGLQSTGALSRARVVHFGTHGLVSGELGGLAEPALALSPPAGDAPVAVAGEEGRVDDGLLTASEAARLRLSADWVILSACNTAAAGSPDAEGLTGLARAFFYAGAGALLVSHWPVEDETSARLIADSVGRAAAPGTDRPEAVRQAMRALIADPARDADHTPLSHPALWAPFQIIGAD